MDAYTVDQGAPLYVEVTLRDEDGKVVGFDGTQGLTAEVWPGATHPALLSAAASWVDPSGGRLGATFPGAQTAGLAPGRYWLRVWVDYGGDRVAGYTAAVDVRPSAGTTPAPRAYTTFADLKRYARGWLKELQDLDDGTGYLEEQGRARSWLEDCAHAHYRVSSMALVVGGRGVGPRRSGARSLWLQQQLDADALMVTDQVRECLAKKALGYACEGRVDGDPKSKYGRLARYYHGEANAIACGLTLQLDTNADGFCDVAIDLSSTDPMMG